MLGDNYEFAKVLCLKYYYYIFEVDKTFCLSWSFLERRWGWDGGQWWAPAESKAWYVSGLQMGGGDQGDTYMTPGMLQNHATRAFSAYRPLGGPDMATGAIDIALGWVHNVQFGQESHKMELSEKQTALGDVEHYFHRDCKGLLKSCHYSCRSLGWKWLNKSNVHQKEHEQHFGHCIIIYHYARMRSMLKRQ